jgi:benzoyl-CoA reductase/2-hydroxyglutaryl-CoA dehydratase subunit BcrC/BadD/HgdB
VVAETTCDGKKKMFELIAQRKPTHILELTQKVDEPAAYDHWYREIVGLKEFLERTLSVAISEDALRAAIREMNEWRRLLGQLYDYTRCHPPVLRGTQLLRTREHTVGNPRAYEMLRRLAEALQAKKERGEYATSPTAPRVLMTGCPTGVGVDKVVRIIEELGGAVVCQEACSGIKPIADLVEETGEPLAAIARKYLALPCSCMTPNRRRVDLLRRLIPDFHAAGVVDLVWTACHTYNVESQLVRRMVTEEMGLPYLKVETDYSPSDREQLAARLEAFLELLRR